MGLTRREFVVGSMGLLAAGCADTPALISHRPGPIWPQSHRPIPEGGWKTFPPQRTTPLPRQVSATPVPIGPIRAIPRQRWATQPPIQGRLNGMSRVQRITVHHEGWTPIWFDDATTTAQRLELIRQSHLERLHAGDIGYHLVVDRAGRLWQGRDLRYQGAHVRNHNLGNIGIMCLGNFDLQRPSDPQIETLRQTIARLMKQNRIPLANVHTHQELNPTMCPGKSLQSPMVALRHNGGLS